MNCMKTVLALVSLSAAMPLCAETLPPRAETLALGREIASHGTLATLIPLMAKKEAEELIEKQVGLSDAEKDALRRIAANRSQARLGELLDAQAAIYAQEMSATELQALVDFVRSDAAKKQNALQPKLIIGSMAVLDGVDFKDEVMAEFCAQTGKGCEQDE